MENASKALLMAAGVLIGVLILSLAAYLIATFGASSAEIQKINEDKILSEFNSKFTVYDGRNDLTIYDIITVINYAKENNEKYNLDESDRGNDNTFYINVKFNNKDVETSNIEEQNKLLEENLVSQNGLFSCKVKISSKTQRVYQIIFK